MILAMALALAVQTQQRMDDGEHAAAWQAVPASGVSMQLSNDNGRHGRALRIDFDFKGGGGWAAFRKEIPLQLPENYEISFWLRGDAPSNTLEFKLVDVAGDNVWWVNRPEFEFRGDWKQVTFRKRHITFAWGPKGGGDITDVAAIEFAITAGSGGKGTIWIDDLVLTPRAPVRGYAGPPIITRTTASYTMDLREPQEYGGLIVGWKAAGRDRAYDVQLSSDAQSWQTVRAVRGGRRMTDALQLPEAESRYVRIVMLANDSTGSIQDVRIAPLEFGASSNRMFAEIAQRAGGDLYPRYFTGTQTYWTVVGNPRARREALINQDGAIEVDKRSFSLEPFLVDDGRLIGWRAASTVALERGHLPIPSVVWQRNEVELRTTTWADADALWVRYRVRNLSEQRRNVTLYVALRPFQVNPPTQFLNTPGGATRITRMSFDGTRVGVDSAIVLAVTKPIAFGAATFDNGDITDYLRGGMLPQAQTVTDTIASLASGVLAYALELDALASQDVYIALPFAAGYQFTDPEASLARTIAAWRAELERFEVRIPAARAIGEALRANLAYILINQDDAAIQPGSRSYERSWIRDGSLTSAALLRLGHGADVRRFIEWYTPYQYKDGKVPCCVDRRGADPVPENDSHGQLIYLIAEYFRYTGDTATVRNAWHHVERAVAYLDSLRNSRRTPEYRGTGFWGLLPESISHEGYSAKPMHSYWDDFFALKGFKDATWLAQQLGETARAGEWALLRDVFQTDLIDSFHWTMQKHNIDYLAGSVELGDFDATSTTVGLNPAGAQHALPQPALARTFERYWQDFVARRENWQHAQPGDTTARWHAYTPYEWRVVGALVRLGERQRAHEALDWFMRHQRPQGWHHWAEVIYRDPSAAHFIGDMPHTWVGSDFIRSVLDMFVYDEDDALIIGAGIAPSWLERPADTVAVAGLRTPYGPISYRAFRRTPHAVVFTFDQLPQTPRNGLIVRAGFGPELRLRKLPRELVLSY